MDIQRAPLALHERPLRNHSTSCVNCPRGHRPGAELGSLCDCVFRGQLGPVSRYLCCRARWELGSIYFLSAAGAAGLVIPVDTYRRRRATLPYRVDAFRWIYPPCGWCRRISVNLGRWSCVCITDLVLELRAPDLSYSAHAAPLTRFGYAVPGISAVFAPAARARSWAPYVCMFAFMACPTVASVLPSRRTSRCVAALRFAPWAFLSRGGPGPMVACNAWTSARPVPPMSSSS